MEIVVEEFMKSEKTFTNLNKIIQSTNIVLQIPHKFANPKIVAKSKNRSAMRTWGLMLKFIPFGWNAVLTYQCLEAELLQAKR